MLSAGKGIHNTLTSWRCHRAVVSVCLSICTCAFDVQLDACVQKQFAFYKDVVFIKKLDELSETTMETVSTAVSRFSPV